MITNIQKNKENGEDLYFIDTITTYSKHCKAGKGIIVADNLSRLENMLVTRPVLQYIEARIKAGIADLNFRFPRTKQYRIRKLGQCLYIEPVTVAPSRSFESDYVAIIHVKKVSKTGSIDQIERTLFPNAPQDFIKNQKGDEL